MGRTVMDKWLLSKLNTVIKTVDDCLGNFHIPDAMGHTRHVIINGKKYKIHITIDKEEDE